VFKNLAERFDPRDFESPLLVDDEVARAKRPAAVSSPTHTAPGKTAAATFRCRRSSSTPGRRRLNPEHIRDRHHEVVRCLGHLEAAVAT
jgi:hypothetical protein